MKCEDFHQHLIDLAYDEASAEICGEIDRHTATCAQCRAAADDIRQTRTFLAAWPEEEPATPIPFLVRTTPRPRLERAGFPRLFYWAAAATLLVAAGAAFFLITQTTLRVQGNVVEIRFGQSQDTLAANSPTRIQDVKRLIAESEERQAERLGELVQNVYVRLEGERQNDRQSIQQGFDLIKEIYMDQIQKNNQLLELSYQNTSFRRDFK